MPRHNSISALPVALSLGLAACADLNRLAPTTGARLSGIDATSSAAPTPSPAPDATSSPAPPPASFAFTWSGLPMVTRRLEVSLASGDTVIASTSLTPGVATWDPGVAPGATLSLEVRAHDERRLVAVATASVVQADGRQTSVELAFQPTVYRFAGTGQEGAFVEGVTAREALLSNCRNLASDGKNLFTSTYTTAPFSAQIMQVDPDGRIHRIAGNGAAVSQEVNDGLSPVDTSKPARDIPLPLPMYLTADIHGNLWMMFRNRRTYRLATRRTDGPWPTLEAGQMAEVLASPLAGTDRFGGLAVQPDGTVLVQTSKGLNSTTWKMRGSTASLEPWFGQQGATNGFTEGDALSGSGLQASRITTSGDGSILLDSYTPEALWFVPASSGNHFGRSMSTGHAYDLMPAIRQNIPPVDPTFTDISGWRTFLSDGSLVMSINNDGLVIKLDHESGKISLLAGFPGRFAEAVPDGLPASEWPVGFLFNITSFTDGRVFLTNMMFHQIYELAL
jgi:hypothetical protein